MKSTKNGERKNQMENVESSINPPVDINFPEVLEGLISIGQIALALALIGGITYYGLKKMTSGGRKS